MFNAVASGWLSLLWNCCRCLRWLRSKDHWRKRRWWRHWWKRRLVRFCRIVYKCCVDSQHRHAVRKTPAQFSLKLLLDCVIRNGRLIRFFWGRSILCGLLRGFQFWFCWLMSRERNHDSARRTGILASDRKTEKCAHTRDSVCTEGACCFLAIQPW